MEPKTELQKNLIANALRKERETYQRAIDIQWFNNRIEDGKMRRCLALINKETEIEKKFKEKTDHAAIVNSRAEKEIAIAYEISEQAREESRHHLRRLYLRETDPQLRELTQKLKQAYIRKDLEQQILLNEYRRLQDKIETSNANNIVQDAIHDDRKAHERDKKEMEKKLQYCTELKTQIGEMQKIKADTQKSEMAMQKKQIDDIVKSMEEDHKRNIQEKQQSVARARQEMYQFETARRELRRREAEALAAEQRRLAREQDTVADRSTAVEQEKLDRQRAREEMNKRIGDQIAAAEADREERAEMIRQLQHLEHLELGTQQERAERARRVANGARVRAALDAQTAARLHAAQAQGAADRAHRVHLEAKVAAEEAKERDNVLLKRERARQYALELQRQIVEDERRRRAERDLEGRGTAVVREYQERWDAEARAEREIILKEHERLLTKD